MAMMAGRVGALAMPASTRKKISQPTLGASAQSMLKMAPPNMANR
jgi:hypothetical protein